MGSTTVRAVLHGWLILCLLVTSAGTIAPPAAAQTASPVSYIYDPLGRLRAVVDSASEAARYTYDAVGNVTSITRQSSATTSIIEFFPSQGPAGTVVTIYGTGFSATSSQNTVTFNGVATTVSAATPTELTVSVPAGATTGSIIVTSPSGSATSGTSFTVAPSQVPGITGITPAIAAPGDTVTVSGSNFETMTTENRVVLNRTHAALTTASATSLAMTVPSRAMSGQVSVTTPFGNALSGTDLFVPPPPFTAADIEVTGRMAIGETKTITIGTGGKIALVVFDGTAGQRVSISINSSTFGSCNFGEGPSLSVLNPDSSTLVPGFCVNSGFFADTRILPVTGTYTILIDPPGTRTGTLTWTLNNVPPDATGTITPDGPAATISTTVPGQNASLTFAGTANQRISLNTNSSTYGSCNFGEGPTVAILNPDGTTMVAGFCANTGVFMDTRLLPQTGTYTITINPPGGRTGSLTLQLYNVPPDVSDMITIGGPSVTITTSVPGQNAELTFGGTMGQRISLNLTGSTYGSCNFGEGPTVAILNPDGTTLVPGVCASGAGTFIDTRVLSQTGTHRITINPPGNRTGTLTLTLYEVPADATGTIEIGGPAVTIGTSVPGQNAALSFTGTAGQQLRLTTTTQSYGSCNFGEGPTVSILNPDSTTLVPGYCAATGSIKDTPVLAQTGTYSIVINPPGARTGSVTMTLAALGSGLLWPGDGIVAAAQAELMGLPSALTPADLATDTDLVVQATPTAEPSRRSQTQPADDPAAGPEEWIPDARNLRGDWTSGRPAPAPVSPPLQGPPGVTALAGQVLALNGRPLEGVTIELGDAEATTDATGRFLLVDLPAGRHALEIDGSTANRPGRTYGLFEVGVEIHTGGTNILPYTIWLPRLDTAHTQTVSSPTTGEVVITTPRIPGLEVRIPAGSTITDEDEQPVTELGITAIPIDRPPFPLPVNTDVPVYFTVQPGGAYVFPKGARVIYPNYPGLAPGTLVSFWNYDPHERGWHIYGTGQVSADGKQVVPDPGVVIYEFTGAMFSTGDSPPPTGPKPGQDDSGGDPVDLATGLFVLDKTDLVLPDSMPLMLTRTYRPNDTVSRPFGIGMTHPYAMFVWSAQQYVEADLILPDGGRVHYVRISPGTGWTDAVFEHTATPTAFYKSRITWNGNGWDLVLRDGTVYVFGENAPLQAIRDRNGNQITLTRTNGQRGNIARIHSPHGRWIELSYDASNRITQAKDNIGRTVTYTYDASGRLWKVTDPNGGVTEYTYDASHRMLTLKDARSVVFLTNQYDTNGRVIKQTQADGTFFQFAYTLDAGGKVIQTDVTDPRGNVRRITFNADGFAATDTAAFGTAAQQTTTYERQAGSGLVTATTDALNRRTTFSYDERGNLTGSTRLAGTAEAVSVAMTYEPVFNQVTGITDPLQHTTAFGYDAKGNLTSVTDPLNHRTTFAHNAAGQPLTITDALQRTTTLTYDLGDLVAVTNPLGQTSKRFVDGAGRVTAVRDALGHLTRSQYDVLNRLTKVTDTLGGVTALTYDANGNRLSLTDARGNATSYAYDSMDRLTSRTNPLRAADSFAYDANGNLGQVTDRKRQVTSFTYDALDRLTQTTFADSSTITNTYDAGNRLTRAVDSRNGTITRAWDNLDRLMSEATAQGTVGYGYDAAGRRTSLTVSGQAAISYAYDNADRLTQITQGTSVTTSMYDDADRRTRLTLPSGVRIDYGYDDADRLTSLTYLQGASPLGDLAYAYDATGRRTRLSGSFARTGLPAAVSTATYNANNQLTRWGGARLTYDNNGNMTSDGTQDYTWDARGQLTTITSGRTSVASFAYDAVGRRTSKTIGGQTTGFLYDGDSPVQELAGGSPSATLLTGTGVDEVLTRTDAAGARTLLPDGLGSTVALVDSAGTIQTSYTYEPFGTTTVAGAASSNPYQYTGRENDGTGLYFYRARYYHPALQRFLSEDPIGFGAGDTNLYAYVGNDPTNLTDPSGEIVPLLAACAVGALSSVAFDAGLAYLGGRKLSGEEVLASAALGCTFSFAGPLAGKALGAAGKAVGGQVGRVGQRVGKAIGAACSFDADTAVATPDGEKPISQIQAGDLVLAYDEATGTTGAYPVTAAHEHTDPEIIHVTIAGEVLDTTAEHPFSTQERGWVAAGELWVGARVRTAGGHYDRVEAIAREARPEVMYNLTVARAHTFFVGGGRWLVHNSCVPSPGQMPEWVRSAGTFVNWMKNMERLYREAKYIPTREEVDVMVNAAKKYGVKYRLDPPHPGTPWNIPHINFGDVARTHVPVPPGYVLP